MLKNKLITVESEKNIFNDKFYDNEKNVSFLKENYTVMENKLNEKEKEFLEIVKENEIFKKNVSLNNLLIIITIIIKIEQINNEKIDLFNKSDNNIEFQLIVNIIK